MLSISEAAALAAAPTCMSIDPHIRSLLAKRVKDWTDTAVLDLTHLIVFEIGDNEDDILREATINPLVDAVTGERYRSPAFMPHWEWLQKHNGFFELIWTVGNDGFAFVMIVCDEEGVDSEIRAMCHEYAGADPCAGS